MKQKKVKSMALMGLLAAILIIMCYTPLGYLNIGPLAVTFNTIPVAIGALALGPVGGAVTGGVFGLTSFLQCFGISQLGTNLFAISPLLTIVQCFVPRILDGFLIGLISKGLKSRCSSTFVNGSIVGFCAAFFNTLFYMTSLILVFGNTEYIQSIWTTVAKGKNAFLFVCAFVGINAVVEWISTTVITGAVGAALSKAKLIDGAKSSKNAVKA